ncbi:MAG: 4-phosphoerythronate dehydrogenase PdxB [Bacteroidaceae bacterium]|nr:4-phosphoerythronate dehydrogenase PdxB [Bacteroidaceae bacterium]
MKVIIDNKIPYIKEAIEQIADETVYAPGKEFTPALIHNADALIIRTRTICNRELLQGSKVKFIATATIGFDHIDTAYCKKNGITWINAPGCNSSAVKQYLQSTLLIWESLEHRNLKNTTIGIIGLGHVGAKVAEAAQELGMRALYYDLPRMDKEGDTGFSSLEELANKCDVITFHVPLNKEGKYKTEHFADCHFFQSLQKKPLIINTSRGEVIETEALLDALNKGLVSNAAIDVWENEPDINRELLNKIMISTPHIAGYSADGKANATRMSLDSFCRFYGINTTYQITPPAPEQQIIEAGSRKEALLKIYNPLEDSAILKSKPQSFESLRGNYHLRRETAAYQIEII